MFLDGVGIGPADPALNPFLTSHIPHLRRLAGRGSLCLEAGVRKAPSQTRRDPSPPMEEIPVDPWARQGIVVPLDPLMGVEGLPQSGTGQTALMTGENAATLYGRHFGPWVPVPLRPLMMERNLLSVARRRGLTCAFANAYPSRYQEMAWTRRPAGPPLAARGAGLLTRSERELALGGAVSSEIVNTAWRSRLGLTDIPEITPEEAGRNLARITFGVDLTLFAHYSTDIAGHERTLNAAEQALQRFDRFLGGLLEALPPEVLLVIASDHGNIEDVSQGHTLNPTFNVLAGPGAPELAARICRITDLAGALLACLSGEV